MGQTIIVAGGLIYMAGALQEVLKRLEDSFKEIAT
jgi:hypothetical protein